MVTSIRNELSCRSIPAEENFWKILYIFCRLVYSMGEQSRRPRVKCRQNGELSDGRRSLSAMRCPHPLRHMGFTSFM